MIRYALKEEKELFYALWKEAFAFDDGGFTDFYFDEYYPLGKHYILIEEGDVVSVASTFNNAYVLNDAVLSASMIVGVITKEKYRHMGKMKILLKEILDQLSHQELVTFIQAYNPEIYRSFGFETVYYRALYHFKKESFRYFLKREIVADPSAEELLKAYGSFMKHFHGYKLRDVDYFKRLKRQFQNEGGACAAIYRNDRIYGYIFYYVNEDRIVIEECIYEDFKALCALLSYCLSIKNEVDLLVSGNEKLHRFFTDVPYEIQDYTMARINDYPLFNELYQSDVKDVHEAFALSSKPLFMREVL